MPVWFLWDGADSFLIYSKPGTAKLRNIEERPRVSLHLDGNGAGRRHRRRARRRGDHRTIRRPPALPDYVAKYGAFIERNSWTPESFAADYSVPLRITATKLRGF